MARSFNGTSDVITSALVTASTGPVTMSCWGLVTAVAASARRILYTNGTGSTNGYGMAMVTGNASGAPTLFSVFTGGIAWHDATMSPSPNVWYNLVMTVNSGTLNLYINGTNQLNSSGNTVNTPTTSAIVGSDGVGFLNGRAYDAAMWSVVLSTAEISALAAGARPYQIRRSALLQWLPLDGLQSPEPDLSGAKLNGTLTGTTFGAGPPTMMFTPRQPQFLAPSAAPSFLPAWAMKRNISADGVAT